MACETVKIVKQDESLPSFDFAISKASHTTHHDNDQRDHYQQGACETHVGARRVSGRLQGRGGEGCGCLPYDLVRGVTYSNKHMLILSQYRS